jgi:tetratricopeptide (TPR) repeat protein
VGSRNALSLCLQRLDRPAEAIPHIDALLKKNPDLGFAHANRGNAMIALGALGQARQSHLRAVELDPGNFVSMAALASIATHRGVHSEARQWAEKSLAVSPGFPDAVLSLAAAELADGATARAETLLHQVILHSRAGPTDKARATGLLADVLDAAGRYAEAFDAYRTCNDSLQQIHARYAIGTSMTSHARSLTAALREVSATPSTSVPVIAPGADVHVFLIGFPRSGTTLLEVALDAHPRIVSIEEHELLSDSVRRFLREPLDLKPLLHADESQLSALREAYWRRVGQAGVEVAGKVFLDKHPLNTLKLPLIARLFPHAKILFARRDPRDVVLSCFRRRFKMNPAMYELLTLPGAAAFYDAVMEFADVARPILGLEWRDVRYESLVKEFERETRSICEFLDLEWVDGMQNFAQRVQQREHSTPSTAQLARGLNQSGIDQWRHYEQALQPALPTLEPWIDKFGYRG